MAAKLKKTEKKFFSCRGNHSTTLIVAMFRSENETDSRITLRVATGGKKTAR